MIPYDRQRSALTQQQHSPAIMSQNVPSSAASNLSPTQSQMSMQGRLQSQSQLDSMRSMSQQPSAAAAAWSGGYHAQPPSQAAYPSVMNPYMPYGATGPVQNHNPPAVAQSPTARPPINQKSSNGNAPYPAPMYGQPPSSVPGGNGSYYGYDPYYNQMASQAPDPYLSNSTAATASQHWSSNNQMISNSSGAPTGPAQPPIRPQVAAQSSSLQSPKDLQSSSDHMIPYDRQRSTLTQQQQQHSPAIMSQNVPSSAASNLSPTQSQMSMQGRLQSQSQLDSMRSMSQQPSAGWSGSYYAQPPSQSPYSSVMNPYGMPYGATGAVQNHSTPPVGQSPTVRPPINQKPTNGSERVHAPYPTHGASIYGQPPTSVPGGTGTYYGYDSYYSQMASQAPDPYLSHSTAANASQHWSGNNQMISNSSGPPPGLSQPTIRPQTGSTNPPSIHPQSPSGSTSLPMSRPPQPQPSLRQDRSPAATHTTSYPSPNQQSSSSKSTSNSLAQLEQMVMPSSGQSTTNTAIKSPTHRSTTSSPSVNTQQQMQYSFNSSGQGSYFSNSGTSAAPTQGTYYPQPYDSGTVDVSRKSDWSEQSTSSAPMIPNPAGPVMIEGSQSGYGQSSYDGAGSYSEYTTLSTPNQARFPATGESGEPLSSDKSDPYAIDSQTFDDYDDQSSAKSKKSRAKKGDDKVKRERKPRAPRAPKGAANAPTQPQSPPRSSLQSQTNKQPLIAPNLEMSPGPLNTSPNTFSSPNQSLTASVGPQPESQPPPPESIMLPGSVPNPIVASKSPAHRLSTESPSATQQQQMQYSYSPATQPPSLYQPPKTPERSPAPTHSTSYPSPNQQSSSKVATNSIVPTEPMVLPGSGQSTTNTAIKSPTHRSTTSSPSINTQQQMQYSFNSSGQGSYFSNSGTSAASSQGTYYPQPYDSANVDLPQKPPGWSEQNATSAPVTNPVADTPTPAMVEGTSQSGYAQPGYENTTSSYSDYPTFSASNQPQFPTPSEVDEPQQSSDKSEPYVTESQTQEDDQIVVKSKKSRAKKSDDKVKKERKPRAPRASKGSTSAATQPQSPSRSDEQYHPMLPQNSETSSVPQSVSPNTLSGSGQRLPTPILPGQESQPIAALSGSAPDSVAAPGSPVFGMSTDSQNATQQQTQYSHSSTSGQILDCEQNQDDTTMPSDQQPTDELKTEGDSEQPAPTPKAKKSRPKKSGEKPKKERKPRTVKEPQPAPEPSGSPIPADETTEPQPVEPTPESTPAEPKPKRIRIRDSSSKGKKKLPKFALKFAKTKKRKRLGSSDNDQSDLDKTPPPSPDEVESGVQKRRSARNTKKLKYNDDLALGFSDSDDDSQILSRAKKASGATPTAEGEIADETVIADEPTVFAAPVEDTMVVEKIMSSRMGKRELEPEPGEVLPPDGTHIEVEEFYVKYKNLSYLHCDWRTLEELEKGDRRVAQKIKRWKQKKDSSSMFSFMDEEVFDPQYCEVDRILAMNEVEEEVPESDDEQETQANELKDAAPVENNAETEAETGKSEKSLEDQSATEEPTSIKNQVENSESPGNQTSVIDDETPKEPEISQKPTEEVKTEIEPDQKMEAETESDKSKEKELSCVEVKMDCNDNVPQASDANIQEAVEPVEKPRKMKKKISRHFLVKWRGLSYEDSTWELEDHLDPDKIKHFLRFKDPPPKSKWKNVKRPKPEEWVRKEASPVYKNNNTLREYQLEGINWLSFCWHQGRNCILADEMGLGKTIQSIAFVNEIYEHGINGPFLIIVPLSTVGNWAREFETWTDLNVITYHGSSTSREMLKEYEMFYRNEQGNRITSYYKFQVMITTFEIILSDCLDLREIPWKCCIIDEAHRLKNRNCKLLEGLRLLNMEHRVLLTGTPLQNNVEELFSLLNFLEPTQFSSTEQFMQEFGDLKTEAQVDKLKLILKPMMLRRLKEDVEKTLAPKEETIVEVELTNIQKKYYRAILEKNFAFLAKGSTNNNIPNLMNTMMELRKCCIHPYLINGAEEQIMYEARQTKTAGGEPMSSHQALVNSSGKLVLIDKLLPRLRADGHRVLIFSQMVRCLDILEDYVTHKHYPFERIDGRVRGSDRQQAIDRFSKPGSDRFVFLLCTRAGGLGINLTAADTVIIFDSDWNPQNDLQAQARCHRIGQSKAVKIYRLICRNTYEREMFDKASLKLGLDKAVLQSMNTQKGAGGGVDGQLTKKEIEELLRKGAYGALMDDDNAGDKFCEEDIDHILQRRTQVITIDNSEAKGSTFSKATFSSSNNREDIELDDPNFWEKWAKKANFDADDHDKDELIQLAPRRRTQTKRYGADGNLIDISDLDSSEEDEETISMRTRGSRRVQPKLTPISNSKRSKKRFLDFDDDEYMSNVDGGYWSKSDCLKIEKGLLTYGWGRWDKIISSNHFKRDISAEDCESISRVILLYCLKSYKGDEKIKSFAWELITPPEEANKSQSDLESVSSTRGRKPKSSSSMTKKSIADEISESSWSKEAKNDPLIALPDDQYRRHLQRNCNRLLIRVKFLHYLKNDILKGFEERILNDVQCSEIDLPPVSVDGELPASWWDDEADKSLLIGIYKHGHEKFNLMRQDPTLCFLARCGPPNKDELAAEMNTAEKSDDLDDDGRIVSGVANKTRTILGPNNEIIVLRDSDTGIVLDDLVDNVARDVSDLDESKDVVDENKNSVSKCLDPNDSVDDSYENGVAESSQTTKMDMTDDDSMTNEGSIATGTEPAVTSESNGEISAFPSANDLNQRFRRLITAYQRNSKKLEVKMAQKARDELKKERTSKFEAAKNEREERKKFLAQKWSRREEADFFRAISSFGVEYDPVQKRHDWNKFRSLGKLDKKLDDTLEEYYKAFVIMCKKVTSRPLTVDEEKCPINVESITEERAAKCLARIEFLSKIREQTLTHPELPELLKQCAPQNDLPDWWEMGKHDKDLLLAAAKHGLTRLDYNLAHDSSLSFCDLIRQKAENLISQPPTSIFIPLAQMQELLDRNGIEYSKELDLSDESDEITGVISDIIASIEAPATEAKSFADLVDGPHSVSESSEKSLLAITNSTTTTPKFTRSSANLSQTRPLPSIISRRSTSRSDNGIQLTPVEKPGRSKVVEITPIMPDKLPDELIKSFEAGEITVKIISESALVKLDDREPIILAGATNPVNLKIRWPRDKAIQTRLENLVTLVEKGEWPTPPKPTIPTITLPNPIPPPPLPTTPLNVFPSPPKNDKPDLPLGSPKSDTSNMSKQESRDALNDLSASRNRRTRGRRPKQAEAEPNAMAPNLDSPKEDRNATAKLRNLLSQGSNSKGSSSPSAEKPSSKLGNSSKQSPQSSPLTTSFKQKRNDGSGSSRARDDQALDLNTAGAGSTANLLPQILASLKPEFRDLLANQDAAAMLLNSFSNMTGAKNLGANLKGGLSGQFSLDNLLNPPTRSSSTKGPPPAHQRSDNAPSGHSSTRELRRGSHATGDKSPPSFNLRSTRGRGSPASDTFSHGKPAEMAHNKTPGAKKRGRPSSTSSEAAPNAGSDVLDLSSLDARGGQSSSSRQDSRPRRNREYGEDSSSQLGGKSSPMTKGSSKNEQKVSPPTETGSIRTTRASKRASGSRIDALALNLQAKRMNRGDSPTLSDNPSPGLNESMQQTTNFSGHASNLTKSSHAPSSSAPTGNRSGSSSGQDRGSRRPRQSSGAPTTTASSMSSDNSSSKRSSSLLANQATTSSPQTSQIKTPASSASLANTAASLNFANQFGNLNPLGGLMNFPGMNELMLQMGNFSGLAAGLPKVSNSLLTNQATSSPQANQMQTSAASSSLPQSLVNSAASLNFANQFGNLGALGGPLNFSGMNEFMKQMSNLSAPPNNLPKTKQSSNFSGHASNLTKSSHAPGSSAPTSNRSGSSGGQDRGSRRSRQSSGAPTTTASSMSSDNSSSKRSSSLLANQATTSSPQTSQIKTPASSASLANTAASLNFANQFGNLNPLGGLMNFPGMNELMLQMGNFSGLAAGLPKVSNSLLTNQATSSPQANQMQTSAASSLLPQSLVNSAASLNFANQFGNLGALGGPLNFSGMNEFMKQMSNLSAPPSNLPKTKQTSNFSGHASNLTKSSNAPSSSAPTGNRSGSSSGQDRGSRRPRQSSGNPNNTSSGDCLDM